MEHRISIQKHMRMMPPLQAVHVTTPCWASSDLIAHDTSLAHASQQPADLDQLCVGTWVQLSAPNGLVLFVNTD